MCSIADVIIVGGGITGLSTAVHLKLLGVERVVVLERHHVGSGQSGRAAGIVRSLVCHPDLARWLLESIEFFRNLPERFDQPLRVHPTGYLLIGGPEHVDRMDTALHCASQVGGDSRRIGTREASELQPGIVQDEGTNYAYEPGAVYVDPMSATQTVARIARRLGVEIRQGCVVQKVLVEGERVRGVICSDERYHSPNVLLSTASWGARLLQAIDVEVPVHNHRVEVAIFQAPYAPDQRLVRILSDARSMLYLRPDGADQMFVGWREGDRIATMNDCVPADPDNYWQSAHYESLDDMQRRLTKTLPFMQDGFVQRSYACVYDYTPDALPILDQADKAGGLFFAIGFSGGGFSLSPFVGRTMAQFIVTGKRTQEIEVLSLARFRMGKLIEWSNVKAPAVREG